MKFSAIADKIGITQASSLNSQPDHDPEITGVAPVDEATAGTLSYIEGPKFAAFAATTSASALILPEDEVLQAKATERGIAWLSTTDPRLAFARAIGLFLRSLSACGGNSSHGSHRPIGHLRRKRLHRCPCSNPGRGPSGPQRLHSSQRHGLPQRAHWGWHRAPRQLRHPRAVTNRCRLRHP